MKNLAICLVAFGSVAGGYSANGTMVINVNHHDSLVAVRDRVRALPIASKSGGVEIVLAPGDYFLSDELQLVATDSGLSEKTPIVWRAAEKGKVRILGARIVPAERFKVVKDAAILARLPEAARGRVVSADVSDLLPTKMPPFDTAFSQAPPAPLVLIDGKFATLAKWPNGDGWSSFTERVDRGVTKGDNIFLNGAFIYAEPRARRWNIANGVWLNGYWTHDWNNASVKVGSYGSENGTNNVMRLAGGVPYGVMSGTYGGHKGRRIRAFNLLEELDEAGEYWLDRLNGRIYLVALQGRLPKEVMLALSEKTLLNLVRASNLRFEGIEFTCNYGPLVTASDCTAVIFADCRMANTANGGISLSGSRNRLVGCEVCNCGTYGISISGGNRCNLVRSDSFVENCRIHDFGIYQRTYAPGIGVGGVGITVRGNEIYSAPHTAVLYGGNEMLFEHNDVHDVLLETGDAGAFYTGRDWTTQGNVLRYNFVHELGVGGAEACTMGFYFDDCDCGDSVYGNVFWKVACGVLIGGGREHPVRSNVFAKCKIGISIDNRGMTWKKLNNKGRGDSSWMLEDKAKALRYTEEPWKSKYPKLANIMNDSPQEPLYNPVEGNVFIDCSQHLVSLGGKSMDPILPKMVFGGNLVYASSPDVKSAAPDKRIDGAFVILTNGIDAGFVDPGRGDFRLKPNADIAKRLPEFSRLPLPKVRFRTPWNLMCERMDDPVGIDVKRPRFSWRLPDGVRRQTAYEIEADGWTSGRVGSSQQIDVPWNGPALHTSQRISWRVRVWDENGVVSGWSDFATFVMGVMSPADWSARWIGPDASTRGPGVDDELASPAFARTFTASKPVSNATLHVTGLGFYEAYLNGKRIGRKVLDPSPTDYTKRICYSTYVLDPMVREGDNTLKIILGHGWYDMRSKAAWKFSEAPWRGVPKTIAQLELVYVDGSTELVTTGAEWDQVESEVVFDDIREGEVRGRRHEGVMRIPKGLKAAVVPEPAGRLVASAFPGAEVVEMIMPQEMHRDRHGNWIVTFPENLSGWARIDFRGLKADDEVSIRYDENLTPEGDAPITSYREGHNPKTDGKPDERFIDMFFYKGAGQRFLRGKSEMQCDHFISSGRSVERFEPAFVYHGFRHLVIGGYHGELKPDDVRACFVRTAFVETGRFSCSDAKLTELVRLALNSYKSNFTDGIPTDCPHREKLGWTGDAWVASEFAQYFFENTAAYRKWYNDVLDTMKPTGELSCVAPTAGFGYDWGNGPSFDAAVGMIPLNLWRYRADRALVDMAYPALVSYLRHLKSIESAPDLVRKGLGDWNSEVGSRKRAPAPDPEFVNSAIYLRLREIAAEFAEVRKLTVEAKAFRIAAERTRTALHKKFHVGNGVYANGLMTAQALAVLFRLAPNADVQDAAERRLVENAVRQGPGWGEFGLMGSKYAYRALSAIGRGDLALHMLVSEDEHAPTRWIGKTGTLWEDRGFGLSKNHVMLGDFAAWAMECVVGFSPASPGFRRINIKPHPIAGLSWAKGETETPYGLLRVEWKTAGGRFSLKLEIPSGTMADVKFPDGKECSVGPGVHEL